MIFSLLKSIRSPTTVDFLIFGKVTTTGAACAGVLNALHELIARLRYQYTCNVYVRKKNDMSAI